MAKKPATPKTAADRAVKAGSAKTQPAGAHAQGKRPELDDAPKLKTAANKRAAAAKPASGPASGKDKAKKANATASAAKKTETKPAAKAKSAAKPAAKAATPQRAASAKTKAPVVVAEEPVANDRASRTAAMKAAAAKTEARKTANQAGSEKKTSAAGKTVKKTQSTAAPGKNESRKPAPAKPAPAQNSAGKKEAKPAAKSAAPIKRTRGQAPTQSETGPGERSEPKSAPKPASKTSKKTEPANTGATAARPKPGVPLVPELQQPTGMYNGIIVTHEIKPFPEKTPYTQAELDKLRQALMEERQRLLDHLATLEDASMDALVSAKEGSGYSIHLAEHASDLQTAEANLGVRSIEEERLAQVDDALERLEHNLNRYGLCLACGNKIGIQRLIARPHAHLCMACRKRYESIRSRRGY